MQLKRGAKLLTIVGLTTKHADSRVTFISNTFVTYDYLSELIHPSLFSTLVLLYMSQFALFVRSTGTYRNRKHGLVYSKVRLRMKTITCGN